MSEINQVKQYLKEISGGKVFALAELQRFGSAENIRKILSRLVDRGDVKRVIRGVYVKPEISIIAGEVPPSAHEVVKAITKNTGETIALQGADLANRLHLTTQVPMKLIFYTSGNTRAVRVGSREIMLKHVSPKKLMLAGTLVGDVLAALWYVGREHVTQETIKIIQQQLNQDEFASILHALSQMPAWMAKQFYLYNQRQEKRKNGH